MPLARRWGVNLAPSPVCEGHASPAEFVAAQIYTRPPVSLWVGPRGGGKSFASAFGTWCDSQRYDDHGTRILGGSLAQSEQIYEALRMFDRAHPDRSPLTAFTKRKATFATGSEVSILAASSTSVRGPHVATLRLDEVDEIEGDIRESAMGMCMALRGVSASVVMTSTWHRVGGPMTELIERGKAGAFPVKTFCLFEILERCPEERSGPNLEYCPACPLKPSCHADIERTGVPKAKRSSGHYTIDSALQKLTVLSERVFRSDYLCEGPRAEGIWFTQFSPANITEAAEIDPMLPVWASIDSGVFTGGVFFQVRVPQSGNPGAPGSGDLQINVFADYLSEGQTAERSAGDVLAILQERAAGQGRRVSTDSAGGARNPVGPTVLAEYERAGLRGEKGIECWPKYPGCVSDGLQLIEALIKSADGTVHLTVHPRCVRLIAALQSYTRARRGGQWMDYPEDPQHPQEDLIDALRGGLKIAAPESRKPQPRYNRVPFSKIL